MTSRVGLHHRRCPLGELAAEIQCHHVVRDRHHKTHVMFDQQDRDVALVANPSNEVAEHVNFLVVEARRRASSSSRIFGSAASAPRQFHAFLGAERQTGNRDVGDVIEVEIIDDFVDALVELGLAAAHPGQLQGVADNVAVGAGMGADADVCRAPTNWQIARRSGRCGRCRFRRSGAAGASKCSRLPIRISPALGW